VSILVGGVLLRSAYHGMFVNRYGDFDSVYSVQCDLRAVIKITIFSTNCIYKTYFFCSACFGSRPPSSESNS
jgi:hypothetical protein